MGGNMRFLIPTFPFFAVGGAWLLSRLAHDLGPAGRVAVGVVAGLQVLMTVSSSQQTLARTKTSLTAAARARATAEKQVPAGSILIVDRSLAESIDAGSAWRLVEESFVGGMGGRMGPGGPGPGMGGGGRGIAGDPTRPSPQQIGKNRAQQERYAGLSASERRARVWADVTTWAAGRPIYWFSRSVDAVETALPAGADYETVAEIDVPAMGFGPGGGGPMGPGGFGGGARGGRGGMGGGGFDPMQGGGPRGAGFGRMGGGMGQSEQGANAGSKLRLVKITLAKT
jgi:hypothetical protein